MKLSIVMPVYNEEKTLIEILKKVKSLDIDKEIIIVDDGSTDKTKEILKTINNKDIKIFFHNKNQGKGAAIRTGLSHATGDAIVIQDADLEYNPNEFYNMLDILKQEEYDVIYGSRMIGKLTGFKIRSHYLGNKILSLVTTALYFNKITDMETCYKMFKKEVVEGMQLKSNSFNIEPEITAKILKRGYKIKEIPISYNCRTFEEGKKINWKDGVKAIYYLIKYRFFN